MLDCYRQLPDLVDWSQPVADDPLNDWLTDWWLAVPGNMGFGSLTWRSMLYRNNGTLTSMATPATSTSGWGATTRPGGFGEMRYDGSNDLVNCGTATSLQFQSMTVACWVYQIARSANTAPVFCRMDAFNLGGYHFGLRQTNGQPGLFYYDGAQRGWYADSRTVPLTTWTHVVFTWAPGTFTAYINGIAGTPVSTASGAITHVAGDIARIGQQPNNNSFQGNIDDVRAYGYVMSPSTILSLYLASKDYYPTQLNRVDFESYMLASGNRRRRVLLVGD